MLRTVVYTGTTQLQTLHIPYT